MLLFYLGYILLNTRIISAIILMTIDINVRENNRYKNVNRRQLYPFQFERETIRLS